MNGAIRDAVMTWRAARADFTDKPAYHRAVLVQHHARHHRELVRKTFNVFDGGRSR